MKLLLASVFRPFGVDDEFNRRENVLEQMHNSITRAQGVFSIHAHNRSFGLTLLAENIRVPTTVLDFPTLDEFKAEVARGYTHVGISFIASSVGKAAVMAKHVRACHPQVTIYLGGHGAQIADIEKHVPCDGVCRMEGIAWLRERFDENATAPIVHPAMPMEFWRKIMGVPMVPKKAMIIPGVGCVNGCDFCSTTHYFQGYRPFFKSTADLFAAMVRIADTLGVNDFWVLDENFLENEQRVRELIDLMERHQRFFCLDLFASLRAASRFSARDLVRLGAQFIWIGIESKRPLYPKTVGVDAPALFGDLRRHGISLLASTILFLEHHDRAALFADVDYTIALQPDFTQFITLAPVPGTRLHQRLTETGRIIEEIPMVERHGQGRIWFRHPHFTPDQTKAVIDEAFAREAAALGPSLMRYARTKLTGYQTIKAMNDPALAVRLAQARQFALEMRPLLYSCERLAPTPRIAALARRLRADYAAEFGPLAVGEVAATGIVHLLARIEQRRLQRKYVAHQPQTFVDRYRQ